MNTCTRQETLDHFYLWLMNKYDYLALERIEQIMNMADALLMDDLDYYADLGHRVLYDAVTRECFI